MLHVSALPILERLSSENQADESVTSGAPYGRVESPRKLAKNNIKSRFWQFTVKQFVSGIPLLGEPFLFEVPV